MIRVKGYAGSLDDRPLLKGLQSCVYPALGGNMPAIDLMSASQLLAAGAIIFLSGWDL